MLRYAATTLIMGATLACTTVQHVRKAPDGVRTEALAILWVTNEYNEVIPVAQPRLAGDSLVGTWVGVGRAVAIPLTQGADVRKFDGTRTALVGLGVTAGTVLLLMLNGGGGDGAGAPMGTMCDMDMMDGCM